MVRRQRQLRARLPTPLPLLLRGSECTAARVDAWMADVLMPETFRDGRERQGREGDWRSISEALDTLFSLECDGNTNRVVNHLVGCNRQLVLTKARLATLTRWAKQAMEAS